MTLPRSSVSASPCCPCPETHTQRSVKFSPGRHSLKKKESWTTREMTLPQKWCKRFTLLSEPLRQHKNTGPQKWGKRFTLWSHHPHKVPGVKSTQTTRNINGPLCRSTVHVSCHHRGGWACKSFQKHRLCVTSRPKVPNASLCGLIILTKFLVLKAHKRRRGTLTVHRAGQLSPSRGLGL